MNTNSNSYTIIYASIMVVIVAFLLAFVSSSLKEKQYQNVEQDTKKQILAALNVYDVKDVNAEYDKYVKEDDLMQADGSLVKNDAAFQTSYKGEIAYGRHPELENYLSPFVDAWESDVFMYSFATWMVRPNMCCLFMVPVFGDLSGDTSH